jgi:hypothetical protein
MFCLSKTAPITEKMVRLYDLYFAILRLGFNRSMVKP